MDCGDGSGGDYGDSLRGMRRNRCAFADANTQRDTDLDIRADGNPDARADGDCHGFARSQSAADADRNCSAFANPIRGCRADDDPNHRADPHA